MIYFVAPLTSTYFIEYNYLSMDVEHAKTYPSVILFARNIYVSFFGFMGNTIYTTKCPLGSVNKIVKFFIGVYEWISYKDISPHNFTGIKINQSTILNST